MTLREFIDLATKFANLGDSIDTQFRMVLCGALPEDLNQNAVEYICNNFLRDLAQCSDQELAEEANELLKTLRPTR